MNPEQVIRDHFNKSSATTADTVNSINTHIVQAASIAAKVLENNGKILICGNGGSASDAQHFAAELVCRYERDRQALGAIALTADTSIITAAGNDYDFTQIFSRQVEALGRPNDLLIVITTSGNSPNIDLSVKAAYNLGMQVVALTGKDGGNLASLVKNKGLEVRVPSMVTAHVQETHAIIIHCICNLIELHISEELSL
ncbi:MAG: phosphoheptose isomerase [Acidiferrobacteraceae bacterium]|nr:phosphoheptose isomerase [Acidiferrobacteraceae bacterium]|tara:strand:+ start:698 stop:1294 length:597 start_codon:yes stop_codon:yes gene_type:complete